MNLKFPSKEMSHIKKDRPYSKRKKQMNPAASGFRFLFRKRKKGSPYFFLKKRRTPAFLAARLHFFIILACGPEQDASVPVCPDPCYKKLPAGRNVKKTLPAKTCDLRLHPAFKKKTPLFPQSPSPLIKADGIYIPCDLHLILIIIADPKVPSVDGKPVFSSLDL